MLNLNDFDTINRLCFDGSISDIPYLDVLVLSRSFLALTYGNLFEGRPFVKSGLFPKDIIKFRLSTEKHGVIMSINDIHIGEVNVERMTAHAYNGSGLVGLVKSIVCDNPGKGFVEESMDGDAYFISERQKEIISSAKKSMFLTLKMMASDAAEMADFSGRGDLESVFINAPYYRDHKIESLDNSGKEYKTKSDVATVTKTRQWYKTVSELAHFKADCLRVIDGHVPKTEKGVKIAKDLIRAAQSKS